MFILKESCAVLDFLLKNEKFIKILQSYSPVEKINSLNLESVFNLEIGARSKSFGIKVRLCRETRKYTQVGMANYLNLTRRGYIAWERGEHVPKLSAFCELCKLLQVDPYELIFDLELNIHEDRNNSSSDLVILTPNFLTTTTFQPFLHEFEVKRKQLETIKLFPSVEYDCVYIQDDDSMQSESRTIPKGSNVFCSFKLIKEIDTKSSVEIWDSLSGKVVLLTVLGQRPRLREIYFDGSKLKLIAWNSKVPDMELPTGALQDGDRSIHAHNVEFFAVAIDVLYPV